MLALGSDHVGVALKKRIMDYLAEKGIAYRDFGAFEGETGDYPVYGYKAAKAVADGDCERGILVCGTGVGISMAANKVRGIRCVVCSEPYSAVLSRQHNDSNMLSLGARVVGSELAIMIVDGWLTAEFMGERHARRVDMITAIEAAQCEGGEVDFAK